MKVLATFKPVEYKDISSDLYGVLAEIDWDTKTVLRSLKIPMASFHDGAAFMTPVLSGLCTLGRRVFVAAWNFIVEIDYDTFQVVNAVSWPPMADLHGMSTDGRDLWIASSAIDAVLCLDADSLQLKWRWGPDQPILWRDRMAGHNGEGRIAPLSLDRIPLFGRLFTRPDNNRFVDRDYRYIHKNNTGYHYHHLNGAFYHAGALYITTKGWNGESEKSAVLRLDLQTLRAEFFASPGSFCGMHDAVFVNETLYVTEAKANSVAWRTPDGNITSRKIEPAGYFVRGLCYTDSSFLVGFSTWRNSNLPAQIVEYDTQFEHQLSAMDVSMFYPEGKKTAVFTLVCSPGGAPDSV
jgi:hypothetical protein